MPLATSSSYASAVIPAPVPPQVLDATPTLAPTVSMEARRWIALAIGSLVVAGLLSLAVVIGRLPMLSRLIDDPLFFKRCLVVHVDLSLLVWFYAFLAGLVSLSGPLRRTGRWSFPVSSVAVVGVGAMLVGGLVRGAQPILANYVPVIHHPLFLGGLALFFVAVLAHVVPILITPEAGRRQLVLPAATAVGVRVAAVALVLAAVTWIAAVAGLPGGQDAYTFFEFTGWGAGHVLQVANVALMLSIWLWALERATGQPVLSPRVAGVAFALLLAPHLALPLLTARGTLDTLYHSGATQLMRWGIFPVVLALVAVSARHVWRHRSCPSVDPARRALLVGWSASVGLTLLGFGLGACIRSSTTLVPAHYHASLGGVTVSLMLAAYLVASGLAQEARRAPLWRSARWQLGLFGVGQAVFALGFAIGGAYGLGRKAYAAEQQVRSMGEYVGLVVMGLGGLIAVAGGLWFLALLLSQMRGWWPARRR